MAFDAFDLYRTLQEMIPETGTSMDLVGVPIILRQHLLSGSLSQMEPISTNNKPVSLTLRDYSTQGQTR